MYEIAEKPNDLERFFVERANAGDLEGLLMLYEDNAVVADGSNEFVKGKEEIRRFFGEFLKECPQLAESDQSPALIADGIALTSSRLSNGGVTAEIARRQSDGSWLWVIDQFTL